MGVEKNRRKSKRIQRRRRLRKQIIVGFTWILIILCVVLAINILCHVFPEGKNKKSLPEISEEKTVSKEKLNQFKDMYKDMNIGDELCGYTVCVDAGHGGNDVGAERENGVYEKYETLRLARLVRQYLEAVGVNVVMTRENDTTVSLEERRNIAENCHADLLLSIHRNVYEGYGEVNGIEAWIHNAKEQHDMEMAESILGGIIEKIPSINSRGVKWGTMDNVNENYAVNKVSMPSLILEVGFVTSSTDNYYFDNQLEDIAEGIVAGILR